MKITKAQFYGTLAEVNFAEPLRVLHGERPFSRGNARDFGMARAGAAAQVGTDALITAVARPVLTGPVAAWHISALALKQPGARKAGVVVAPIVGLIGGTALGAAGGVLNVAQAGWYLGMVTPANVTVAAVRRAYKAAEKTIDDMFTEMGAFIEARPAEEGPAAAAEPQPNEVAQ